MSDDRELTPAEQRRWLCEIDAAELAANRARDEAQAVPLPPVDVLQAVHVRLVPPPDLAPWPSWACNPSCTYAAGRLLCALRLVEKGTDWRYRRSRTATCEIGPDWRATGWQLVHEGREAEGWILEDARIVYVAGRIALSATARRYGQSGEFCMGLGWLSTDLARLEDWRLLASPRPCEKNWAPLVLGGQLAYVYTIDPLQAVVVVDSAVVPDVGELAPIAPGAPRGGSQLVSYGDSWLSIVHETRGALPDYAHRFALFDRSLGRVRLGPQFKIAGRERISFATGLVVTESGGAVVSYGLEDAEARLALVQPHELARLLPALDR